MRIDWEAVSIAVAGVLVFGILTLGATGALADNRYVTPTQAEVKCVRFVSLFTVAANNRGGPEVQGRMFEAIKKQGMDKVALNVVAAWQAGAELPYVLAVGYKQCLAQSGDTVL